MITLRHETPAEWVQVVEGDIDAFLQDHASNERKVSQSALTLCVQHPDRRELCDALIDVAREELEHFRRVYDLLRARGRVLAQDAPDPYMTELRRSLRRTDVEAYLLDRLVLFAIVEARGHERFALLADGLRDESLRRFYASLRGAEARHQAIYLDLARTYFDPPAVDARLEQLLVVEAAAARRSPLSPGSTEMRIVGVFAHPDDEAFAAGGTLALAARLGATVHVVCATRGEGGTCRDEPGLTGAALADRRSAELARSCRTLGAAPPVFLDLPDGAIRADASSRRRLSEVVDGLGPDVVITLGPDGAYGHVDHLACTALVSSLGHRNVLHCAFPRGLFRGVRDRVARVAPALIAAGPLGVDVTGVDLDVDITAVRDQKLAALGAHRSQLAGGDPRSLFPPRIVEHLLERERFTIAPFPADWS